ncbi:MAG: helix-turn-helix transcriptional regulator [Chloroflexaceae bacterium]|jgi:DNA-binding Xre family transcriptional regulator|nr:helix-turn-helix transcriptional regulator [Chloroflexaceae bacterium]
MITLRVQAVAQSRGITTIKDFAEKAQLAYDTAADLWHGRMKRIDLVVFYRVCKALQCAPSDLLDYEEWAALHAAAA